MIKWVNQLKGVIERVSKGNSDLVNPLIDDNSENLIIVENSVSACTFFLQYIVSLA